MSKDPKAALKRAAEAAGGFPALAASLGITRHAVYQWDEVPAERVVEVERLTGVSRGDLRPDLFDGYAPTQAGAAA